jgi:phage RecT family recombinase
MNLEYIYKLARENSLEDFLKKINEQPKPISDTPANRFVSMMAKYEHRVLPNLLKEFNTQISPSKFAQIVINEVKRDESLLNAFVQNPSSLFASILAGAEIGLAPTNGEFFLIPRNIKQSNGSYKLTVTPQIGYKGLVKILLRSGDIKNIEAHIVYEGEKFSVALGTTPNLKHTPKFSIKRTADKITHGYAIAYFKNGGFQFQVMTREEIEAVRNMSKYNNNLYFNDTDNPNRWMERKCCLIQLAKMLDKDFYGTKALDLENKLEVGTTLTLDENDRILYLDNKQLQKPKRFRDIYGTLGN